MGLASRVFNRKQALEKEVKDVYAEIAIGTSGAPTLVSPIGIASIDRNSAGDYTLTLSDKYFSLKNFKCARMLSTAEDISVQVHTESVDNTKEIRFLTQTETTATDPADGTVLLIKLELKNSGV